MDCTQADHPEVEDRLLPRVEPRSCERHGDGSLVLGDLEWQHMLDPQDYYSSHFPIEWLAYELFLLVRRSPF